MLMELMTGQHIGHTLTDRTIMGTAIKSLIKNYDKNLDSLKIEI